MRDYYHSKHMFSNINNGNMFATDNEPVQTIKAKHKHSIYRQCGTASAQWEKMSKGWHPGH